MSGGRFRTRGVLALSSVFGLGYMPVAPGTWGTLAALPLWWALAPFGVPMFATATLVITAVAIWISGRAERIYGTHDVGHIVIDEVAGMLVTAVGVPFTWPTVVAAFVLFRLLDALKPGPIGWFDRNVQGGLGVVVDDVVAGAVACGVLHAAHAVVGRWA